MRTRATRAVRAVIGAVLVLVSYPIVLASAGLWFVAEHRDPAGSYTATTQHLASQGYALVIDDIDALLRANAPFARGGESTLSMSATGPGGPLFLGLAPRAAALRYLAGTTYTTIDRVRPAQGPWPADLTDVTGLATPTGVPFGQDFWVASSTGLTRDGQVEDSLSWTPAAFRGQQLALIIMNADASAGVDVQVTSALTPQWLVPMVWGLFTIGGTLLALGLVLLAWPSSHKKVVCIVEEDELPCLTDRWGVRRGDQTHEVAANGGEQKPFEDLRVPGHANGVRLSGGVIHPKPQPRTWSALLASARPPATPRLLWPPKRAERPTNPPLPAAAVVRTAALPGPSEASSRGTSDGD